MPHAFDILAAIALIYGAGVLTGFNLARSVTGFMLGECWEEGDPENGSRALSLKAALASEIVGANEIGVKRAEARPSLRSQFRMGRRRTPVSRRAMWRSNGLRPGHGGANEARIGRRKDARLSIGYARVDRPH
jgi:hypothetical protein